MKALRTPALCLVLFLLALGLRLPGLGASLTPDEGLWADRAAQFLKALDSSDWAATYVTGHPGVTTAWAGVAGLAARWTFSRPDGAASIAGLAETLAANPVRVDFLPWLRLPIVVVSAGGVVLIYLLARRLFREPVALLGAALVSFDPFLLAHGRVLQLDALLATFTTIAWLAMLVATRTWRRRYYVLSGVAFGLAVLTKSPALVLGPPLVGWIIVARIRTARGIAGGARRVVAGTILDLVCLGLPAILAIFLLWPALWTAPIATIQQVWGLMTYYGQVGHELGNYWLGQEVAQPGTLFYPAVLLWRTTAVSLLGLVLALGWAAVAAWNAIARRTAIDAGRQRQPYPANERQTVLGLLLFVAWYGLILSIGDKKFDRYLLPIFPAIDLLAAWGWYVTVGRLAGVLRLRSPRHTGTEVLSSASRARGYALLVVALVLVGGQAASALASQPTYLTAYNPLAGGIKTARGVFIVGWGEGLAEAAGFLNQQPDAANQRTAAWYGQNVFGPFYKGQSFDLYYDVQSAFDLYGKDVDYVVTYVNEQQRNLLDPTVRERLGAPLFASEQAGVPLAQVFAWPKPFAHTAYRSLAPGLRLLGWQVGAYEPNTGLLPVTTYWDASELESTPGADSHVVAWMKDDAGEVWAKAEVALDPANRTAGWLDRPTISQKIELHAPPGLLPGVYRVEVAPFAGETLALGAVPVAPARLVDLAKGGPQASPGVLLGAGDEVLFGNQWRLAGYTQNRDGQTLELDLLWTALNASEPGLKLFVHLVDEQDQIVAQYDGPLARLAVPGVASQPALQPGELARQRVRLQVPGERAGQSYRVYVGVYRTSDQQRLPVVAGGAPIPDGRYPLPVTEPIN